MYRLSLFLIFIVIQFSLSAQQRAIGTWHAYFPYGSITQAEESEDRVYFSAELSVFYVEKADNSVQTLDKASGLSDVKVRKIRYNPTTKTLLIAYENSNIDLLQSGETVYNISDIKQKVITGSKNINDIFMLGQFAYLATDLGIAVMNLEKREIKETYVIGSGGDNVIVNAVTATSDQIFAATQEGVKSASLSSANLLNFNEWTIHTNGITATDVSFIASLGDTVFAGLNDSVILRYDGTQWMPFFSRSGWQLKSFKVEDGKLYAFFWDTGDQHLVLVVDETGNITERQYHESVQPMDIVTDNNNIWIADKLKGALKYSSTGGNASESYIPNGPYSSHVFNMSVDNNTLYLAAGGTNSGYSVYNDFVDGIQTMNNNWWWRMQPYSAAQNALCLDYLAVAYNKITNKAYYASFQHGLTELDLNTGAVNVYNYSNSLLQREQCCDVIRVPSVCVDDWGNVWMMNTGVTKQLVLLKPDGTWKNFSIPYSIGLTRKMLSVNNKIWMCSRRTSGADGIVVYDPGEDVDSETDDKYTLLGTAEGSGHLPSATAWTMAQDKDGYVWVGTDVGIGTFYCPSSLPQQACDADWIKVDQGGFIGYLFSTEVVRALAVDGANRKWVGTLNGVWLISADGKEELLRFTKDNSPLPSNTIVDIAINQQTGEVFVGTDMGLVSYQGDAVLGGEKAENVLVYPNPVRADYDGVIAVKGLVDDAYIKITDAAGNLVFQGRANGGQAVWNGKGYEGNRVKSGVYFVYSATDAGQGKSVAKIVLLN